MHTFSIEYNYYFELFVNFQISIRFTTENVIQCTFSIEPGCFNKQHESEFLEAGKTLFAPSLLVGLKFLAVPILPEWVIDNIPIP